MSIIRIECRDPIQSRDGRPFGNPYGDRAEPPGWPLPSIVVGSLRGAIAKAAGRPFTDDVQRDLLGIAFAGPFPASDRSLYLPAPADCVRERETGKIHAVIPQPMPKNAGCDWPADGLRPVMLTGEQAPEEFKPGHVPAWWPFDRMKAWLLGQRPDQFDETFLESPRIRVDDRTPIEPGSGLAEESLLFSMATLPLSHLERHGSGDPASKQPPKLQQITLAGRIESEGWTAEAAAKLDRLHPLGGKSRLAHWKFEEESARRSGQGKSPWACPGDIAAALRGAGKIRMILATPAIFQDGWKPGWLRPGGGSLVGTPPGTNVRLRLVGTCTRRWGAVAGWSLMGKSRGPKPLKRMVPAGGVYFFERDGGGDPETLAECWLQPVSDNDQDRRDGFGLALWGTWNEQTTGGNEQ
jgi:CRISPR-associated protein Cmr3